MPRGHLESGGLNQFAFSALHLLASVGHTPKPATPCTVTEQPLIVII
jgi:hypothetical protein